MRPMDKAGITRIKRPGARSKAALISGNACSFPESYSKLKLEINAGESVSLGFLTTS